VITDAVKAREPVGGISDIVRDSNNNNIITVYAWSDVQGLKGSSLRYRWIRDGSAVANVTIDVWSNRWRSYSSKFITENMRGSWRVELSNAEGELLAFTEFEY
jgi:hypothetical protein